MGNRLFLNDQEILDGLNELVKETFLLWDEDWVDFSWRYYYFEHTQRVRALSLEIGRHEDADLKKLEYAAILHDITKRYDGKILRDSRGRRILDENGLWRNELLMPKRENMVSKLYREFDQFHKLHNVSGAFIAKKILESYGFPEDFCNSVSSIIESHLKLAIREETLSDTLEKNILYEADTIDANLGLTAFYRNIQIYSHNTIVKKGRPDLQEYVCLIEPWIQTKVPFMNKMITGTGTKIARERYERIRGLSSQIAIEFQNKFTQSVKYGILSCMQIFMDRNRNPNLQEEMNYITTKWIPELKEMLNTEEDPEMQAAFLRTVNFCHLLVLEMEGHA